MKKHILFIAVLFLFTVTNSYSQVGSSEGCLTNTGSGRGVNIVTSNCGAESGFAGVILVNLDGELNTPFYCLDLCTPIDIGDCVADSASTIPYAIYITNNFYPAKPNVLPNINDEGCAVQLAIWHFKNGVDIATVTGPTEIVAIRARANAIIAETILNGGSSTHVTTIEILPAVNPNDFYVRTTDTSGAPIAVNGITLSITGGGSLSTLSVNTDVTGNSPDVIVTGANSGSEISATALVEIPGGISYAGVGEVLQLLVLGRTTEGLRTATITWGALPVELSSFTASSANRNVDLNWSTTSESGNAGFDIERKAVSSNEWNKVGHLSGYGTSATSHNYSYTDRNLKSGSYNYRLKQIDYNGNFEYHNLTGEVVIGTPGEFSLIQNYPNPFNPSTTINFDMPYEGFVTLKVFNTSGKEVATLVNETRTSGYHSVNFNAANLSSGIYYYRLELNGVSKVMKMALIK